MPSKKRTNRIERQADIYARAIHEGKTQRTAYRESHPESKATDESADELGNRWFKRVDVQSRLAELTEQAKAGAIIDDQRAQAMLTMIAMDDTTDKRSRIAALDQLAKRQGCYVEKHEVNGGMKIDLEQARRDAWNALTDA